MSEENDNTSSAAVSHADSFENQKEVDYEIEVDQDDSETDDSE